MLYPIYIHVGNKKYAHGIEFPDFPGCFSAADNWQEINQRTQEAVECHFAGENIAIPAPTSLEKLAKDSRYKGGVWMLVEIDLTRIDPTPKRVNISLPSSLLSQIDAYAEVHHLSRSGFLAKAAQEAMIGD